MKTIIFYDTETTNLPDWKIPSDDPKQPHLVSLTAIKCDAETREEIDRMDVIVKSEGWESSPKAFEAHGITKEYSIEHGIRETDAVLQLIELVGDGETVAHNWYFDYRMIRIQLKRYGLHDLMDPWKDTKHHCTMKMSKPILKLPPYGRYGWKSPKLEEAYEYFTGKKLGDKAHNAKHDAEACMAIYWAMIDRAEPELSTIF